jgi:hypothetical protein
MVKAEHLAQEGPESDQRSVHAIPVTDAVLFEGFLDQLRV